MGRKKGAAYYKDLHQQAYERLISMQAFGESKRDAVADGTASDKIFSFSTYKTYWVTVQNPCLLQDDLSVPSKSSCQSFISADTVLPACANV